MKKSFFLMPLVMSSFFSFAQKKQKNENIDSTERIFTTIDSLPEFPGGLPALSKFLSANIRYPSDAREDGVQGKVFVKFVVCQDGSLCNESVEKSVMPSMDKEVIRVIREMPNWKPGSKNGKPVKVYFTLPVTFRLEDDNIPTALDSFMNSEANNPVQVFSIVNQMPEFKGGEKMMDKFIRENLKYPANAKQAQVQGIVEVKFIVDEIGQVLYPAIGKSLSDSCDDEAIRLVKSMPVWKSGKQNGKPVKVLYTLPVKFEL